MVKVNAMYSILVISFLGKSTYPFEQEPLSYKIVFPKNTIFKSKVVYLSFFPGLDKLVLMYKFRKIDFSKFDLIILNEMINPLPVLRYIHDQGFNGKLVYHLWNTLSKIPKTRFYDAEIDIGIIRENQEKYNYIITSFDKEDCQRYSLDYQKQFAPRLKMVNDKRNGGSDIFFVGQDKNRLSELKRLWIIFRKYNISFESWLLPQSEENIKNYSKEDDRFLAPIRWRYSWVPYREIVKKDNQCKALLDLVQEGQGGITWRPLEALFYQKKLITNFSNIKEYDFYKKENIFILGEDDPDGLPAFINTSYIKVPEKIVHQYTFSGWIERIMRDISR